MRILAIKLKQIGDVLLWEPALRAIKETYPEAELHVITGSYAFPVLKNAPYIDRFFIHDRSIKKLPFLKKAKKELEFVNSFKGNAYDVVINFSPGDRGDLYAFFVRARHKVGIFSKKKLKRLIFDELYNLPDTHTVLQDLWLVSKVLKIEVKSPEVRLYISPSAVERACELLRKSDISREETFVCVHPVAGWFLKCWPAKHQAEVIKWFLTQGLKVVITAGASEREIKFVEEIIKLAGYPKGLVNFAGRLTLEELAGILYWCRLFFGIDTAPMHMAAALNKPVIAIFGPTGKHNWGPWENEGSHNSWDSPYKKRGTQRWGKHLVFQKDWECIPCGGKKSLCRCDLKAPKCLTELSPSLVINELKKFL